jgi:predicted SnoaL-like aldol condensation-catalyzing enzyme
VAPVADRQPGGWEFIDIFRIRDGKLVGHWTHMDFDGLRMQMRPRE